MVESLIDTNNDDLVALTDRPNSGEEVLTDIAALPIVSEQRKHFMYKVLGGMKNEGKTVREANL